MSVPFSAWYPNKIDFVDEIKQCQRLEELRKISSLPGRDAKCKTLVQDALGIRTGGHNYSAWIALWKKKKLTFFLFSGIVYRYKLFFFKTYLLFPTHFTV